MNNFAERFTPFLTSVFHIIGNGWKIDHRDCENRNTHRVKIINPAYRHLMILAGMEKNRFTISIHADRRISPYVESHSCSLSSGHSAVSMARQIEQRITIHAEEMMSMASKHMHDFQQQEQDAQILKNCLSRLFTLQNAFNSLFGFRSKNISANVRSPFSGNYSLNLENLTQDQLIKVAGFISTLKE
ncbi:hypothetical protein WDK74_22240 [Escherichia coli]